MQGIIALDEAFSIERDGAGIRIVLRSGPAEFSFRCSRSMFVMLVEEGHLLLDDIERGCAEVIPFPGRAKSADQ